MQQMMHTFFSAIGFVTISFIIFTSFSNLAEKQNTETNESETTEIVNLPQVVKPIPPITNPSFAGEPMPLNMDTKERLDRELSVNTYWHSSTILNIKNAHKYFPIMEPILAEMGVPDDFKYLAVAESNLRNVQSSAKAKGFWQFRKLAAKELGLEVNEEVDERYHIEKATKAAAGYLKKLYKRFGSWANAAAAYNVGPTNFAKTLKNQKEKSFYDVNVNDETGRYLFRLIAIKEIMKNPVNYGFYLEPQDMYEKIDHVYYVEVKQSVSDWAAFAKHNGVSYRMLKYYNPWLRTGKLTVINNTYKIKLPRNS
ncbi:MAG: lytic transglycosylase domain-containing protein [Saprospiraceae bacterium]|nr:lytic transglycosylase domain-containing protein [Saprospiraceae bacterium]